jgi:prepilin-type N-terminal cleavage/methylation domain-containing protein
MMNRIRRRLASDGGFTLIELLITLTLMGIVMGGITTSFASAFAHETRAIAEATNQEHARLALNRLRMDIHCAYQANGATPNDTGDGGFTFVLAEIVHSSGEQACPRLGLAPGSSWVAWCTIRVGSDNSRYKLYRENVQQCDGVGSTFMVDYITRPDIWDTRENCAPSGWQQYVGVNLVTNLQPSMKTHEYALHDSISLRNSERKELVFSC